MAKPKLTQQETHRMTRYLTTVLCPALGIAPIFDEVDLPENSAKSTILLVRPRGRPAFVLRCLSSASEAEKLVRVARFVGERGLPAPRLIHAEVSPAHFKQHGFGAVVEELVEGSHAEGGAATQEEITGLAKSLARLHATENSQYGSLGKLKNGQFFDAMILTKIENRLAEISKFDPDFKKAWKGQIVAFVKSFRKKWDKDGSYALTHDKINTANVIFTADGRALFLDIVSMRFGAPGKDLAAALYYFCSTEGDEKMLKRVYFDALRTERRIHYERFEPLYRMWHHLGRWAAKSQSLHKRSKRGAENKQGMRESLEQERNATLKWIEARKN